MIKSNGGIIGPDNVTTGGPFGSASGVFKLGEATDLIKESKWPTAGPQGYQSANSLRFNSGSSDYLTRTPSGTGNRRTWTFSAWVKRTNPGTGNQIFQQSQDANNYMKLYFSSDKIYWRGITGGSNSAYIVTNRLFRDVSGWYHIVARFDSTNGTAGDRMRLYVNGVEETSFSTDINPSLNYDSFANTTNPIDIGRDTVNNLNYFNGYMAEVCMVDGQSLDPTSFGEFNSQTGIWVPIDVSGLTFGTNGFYLNFENSGALGNDAAGSNNFTVNNLTSIDQSTDTCSTNFATLNALAKGSSSTFSNGNLTCTTGGAYNTSTSTIGVSSGKWYWEYKLPSGSLNYVLYGITTVEFSANSSDVMTNFKTSYSKTAYANEFRYNTTGGAYSTDTTGFSTDSTGDIVKIALDLDNNFIYVGNGSSWFNSGNPESGASGTGASKSVVAGLTYFPMMITLSNSMEINFGSPPYAISSGNADQNGFGNFEYAPPAGYLSLNTKNLAAVLA